MKSRSEFKRITKEEYPAWVNQLQVSKKSPEEYLTSFANWCVKYAIKNGVGDTKNLGEKLTVHISDTRGRKTVSNNNQGKAVGLCYAVGYSPNGSVRRIEIDREEGDTLKALEIVAHEVSHAILSEGVGHKGDFVKAVFGVFKLGSVPTATSVTMEFAEIVESWVKKAGSYPYIKFIDGRRKQTTRMVKLYCPDVACAGATEKSRLQGQGTIFRVSSAVVEKISESGYNLKCPVCMERAYIDSPVRTNIYV